MCAAGSVGSPSFGSLSRNLVAVVWLSSLNVTKGFRSPTYITRKFLNHCGKSSSHPIT
jgi:hypothetical protein